MFPDTQWYKRYIDLLIYLIKIQPLVYKYTIVTLSVWSLDIKWITIYLIYHIQTVLYTVVVLLVTMVPFWWVCMGFGMGFRCGSFAFIHGCFNWVVVNFYMANAWDQLQTLGPVVCPPVMDARKHHQPPVYLAPLTRFAKSHAYIPG